MKSFHVSIVIILLLFSFQVHLHIFASTSSHDVELDIGWEFDSRTPEGWGNATSEV